MTADQILERYYDQFLRWSLMLTRGDRNLAEDLVQDLCLHLSLSKPDLTSVGNLDGYLYICLRNLYLSGLARSSREAAQFVSTADFDSAAFALTAGPSSDLLQTQNDLLRICNYAVWRKDSSKIASYFILHFFHGYLRREVAAIAQVPMSAIYNKLKIAREEIKNHLEEVNQLHVLSMHRPPDVELLLSPISPAGLFAMTRSRILDARRTGCLPEKDLKHLYRSDTSLHPINCELLSHIVSCDRCLEAISRNFDLPTPDDREPLDILGRGADRSDLSHAGVGSQLRRTFEQKRRRILEHRPKTLSVAVNGRITASHDVESANSRLSSRIDRVDEIQFVEVFSEQQVRLVFLSVMALPPAGPHVQSGSVQLSDERRLELTLRFDGLGLQCDVAYFDPTLDVLVADDEDEYVVDRPHSFVNLESLPARSRLTHFIESIHRFLPNSAPAWSMVLLCVVCAGGYLGYRYRSLPATMSNSSPVLSQAVKAETSALAGQTEHTELDVQSDVEPGRFVKVGTVELWRDGDDGRMAVRLYDSNGTLLAAQWHTKDDKDHPGSYVASASTSDQLRKIMASGLWKQDFSAKSFATSANGHVQEQKTENGYELRAEVLPKSALSVKEAWLELDQNFHPVRHTYRFQDGRDAGNVRFVEASYRKSVISDVPDNVFTSDEVKPRARNSSSLPYPNASAAQKGLSVSLQIAVLNQLSLLDADVREPLEVLATRDGRIKVIGTVSNPGLRERIEAKLSQLPNQELLNVSLNSASSRPASRITAIPSLPDRIYGTDSSVAPVNTLLREVFEAQGVDASKVNPSVQEFSQRTLEHSQRALQEAYALERLGKILTEADPRSLNPVTRTEWTQMVSKHALRLEQQINALHSQLAMLSPQEATLPSISKMLTQIQNPTEFAQATRKLRQRVQGAEQNIGMIFANTSKANREQDIPLAIRNSIESLPIIEVREVEDFAYRLDPSIGLPHRGSEAGGLASSSQ